MPISIKHGSGVEALAMAYGSQAEAAYQRDIIEKEKKAKQKAQRRRLTNTAIMAGVGAAALAMPFVAPLLFAGPAFNAGNAAAVGAYSSGMPYQMAAMVGQTAQQSFLSTATAATQAGVMGLGMAYQAFTPAEEQSAVGNAVFSAGNSAAQVKTQFDQRQADIANQIMRQQQMNMFHSDLQMKNWQQRMVYESDFAMNKLCGDIRANEELKQKIDDITNGIAVEGLGKGDLPSMQKMYQLRGDDIRRRELKLTEQISHSGKPVSIEQAQMAMNDINLKIAKAQDNDDTQTAAQLKNVYDTQLVPAVDEMIAQRVTPAQVRQAEDLARHQIVAEKTTDRHPWIPFVGQDMSTQEAVNWIENTDEGKTALYQRRRRLLRQQFNME